MRTHKADYRRLPKGALVAPLTFCGIMESYTRNRDGSLGRGYNWHRLWKKVDCKKCLAAHAVRETSKGDE